MALTFNQKIRSAINYLLNKKGFHLGHTRYPGGLTGFDLAHDLQQLITKERPLCLDVGANIGQTIEEFTTWLVNPVIHSFEPSSEIFPILEEKKREAGISWNNVHLYNYALGSKIEERELTNYENNQLSSLLSLENTKENPFQGDRNRVKSTEKVAIRTVDDFLTSNNIEHVDLLKMDTQGFDFQVLKGAEESIKAKKIDYIFLEMNFVPMYEGQGGACELISYLETLGQKVVGFYDIYRPTGANHIAWTSTLFGNKDIPTLPR